MNRDDACKDLPFLESSFIVLQTTKLINSFWTKIFGDVVTGDVMFMKIKSSILRYQIVT